MCVCVCVCVNLCVCALWCAFVALECVCMCAFVSVGACVFACGSMEPSVPEAQLLCCLAIVFVQIEIGKNKTSSTYGSLIAVRLVHFR